MELVYSLKDIGEIATRFWKIAGEARIFAFHGEMGAGKTTLIHALCEARGVRDAVTSPTFSIINEYRYPAPGGEASIFHIDLYRLETGEEVIQAGVADYLYGDSICFVEWPEKATGLLPEETLHIYMSIVDSAQRKLRIDDK